MKNGRLKITLKSDICIGSGYSYAGIIDSDVCYDEVGLPFIPGKRLKGCLRETAELSLGSLYSNSDIAGLFGESGGKFGKVRVGNAYIDQYEEIHALLLEEVKEHPEYNSQKVLELYSHVVGQTKLNEQGTAEEQTLRYTRTVNHYSPRGNEMVFLAEVQGDFSDEEIELFENCVKGTRNIGLKRNRGMGSVSCQLEWDNKEESVESHNLPEVGTEEEEVCISYILKNLDPLMLSKESEDESENCVYGQEILGMMAGRYLAVKGSSAEDQAFKDLFLSGKVKYSNLYPYSAGRVYYPAPEYINQLKKTKKLVNTIDRSKLDSIPADDDLYYPKNGNQPKKLKGKFVYLTENAGEASILEIPKEVIYHHRQDREDLEGILYTAEAISPGQIFMGKIYAPRKYSQLLLFLLKDGAIYLGKSKTAQYGCCRLVDEPVVEECKPSMVHGNAGDKILITLLSDAVIYDEEAGEYTVYLDRVYPRLVKDLPISVELDRREEQDGLSCMVSTGRITGYKGVWNLRREVVCGLKAGSALVYQLKEPCDFPQVAFVGDRNHEGLGLISIRPISAEESYVVNYTETTRDTESETREVVFDQELKKLRDRHWLEKELRKYLVESKGIKVGKSTLGRITLMLKESIGEHRGDPREQYKSFAERILSIESNVAREEGVRLLKEFGSSNNREEWELKWQAAERDPDREAMWSDCLMQVLVMTKYEKGAN